MTQERSLRTLAYWLLPPLFCLAVYWHALRTGFLQDDFLWLGLHGHIASASDLWHAVFDPTAHGTWRPLSERAFFIVFTALFGFNPLPFHICMFLTQFASLALLSAIMRRLAGSPVAGFLAPVLWVANSNLLQTMSWASAYMQLLCGFFLLAAFWCRLRHLETGGRRFQVLEWAAFLAGFTAMETAIVYPAIAAVHALLFERKQFRRALPLFIPSLLFLAFHMWIAPKRTSGPYGVHFDASILKTLVIYWNLALAPENFAELTRLPRWTAPALVVCLSAVLLGFVFWSFRRGHKLPLFCLACFLMLLGPVLPLRDHISSYYLTLPVMGIAMLGAAGVAAAWRGPAWCKLAGVSLVICFLAAHVPIARLGSKWWFLESRRVENLAAGVARARQLHPGKIILLAGVDEDLFGKGMWDGMFETLRLGAVYLTPGSESAISPRPDLDLSQYVLHPYLTAYALDRDRLVVYRVGGPRLVAVTQQFAKTFRPAAELTPPRRIDAGSWLSEALLGPSWHGLEGDHRWMPKRATVRLGGPAANQKLYLSGSCVPSLTAAVPLAIRVSADGVPLAPATIPRGARDFALSFDLPAELAGRRAVEIVVESERAVTPADDPREMSLAFGVFEIR